MKHEAPYTCVHADGALCETCFKYEQQLAQLQEENAIIRQKLSDEIRRRVDTEAEAGIKDMALRDLQGILCDPDGNPAFLGSQGDHDVARKAFEALSHPTPHLYSAVVELVEAGEPFIRYYDEVIQTTKAEKRLKEALSTIKKLMGRE